MRAEKKLLSNQKVVVTRAKKQALFLIESIEAHGAQVITFPVIEIRPRDTFEDPGPFAEFHFAVFTSANAVTAFAAGLNAHGRHIAQLRQVPCICAIGPGTTSALAKVGLDWNLKGQESIAESMLHSMRIVAGDLRGKRILLPRGNIARPFLRDELAASGAVVTAPIVYDTVPTNPSETARDALVAAQPDLVIFTSSSTAENFHKILGPARIARLNCAFASIGPQTTATAKRLGMPIAIEPARHDIPSLVDAICNWASAENKNN